jgi:hypothetical protein
MNIKSERTSLLITSIYRNKTKLNKRFTNLITVSLKNNADGIPRFNCCAGRPEEVWRTWTVTIAGMNLQTDRYSSTFFRETAAATYVHFADGLWRGTGGLDRVSSIWVRCFVFRIFSLNLNIYYQRLEREVLLASFKNHHYINSSLKTRILKMGLAFKFWTGQFELGLYITYKHLTHVVNGTTQIPTWRTLDCVPVLFVRFVTCMFNCCSCTVLNSQGLWEALAHEKLHKLMAVA